MKSLLMSRTCFSLLGMALWSGAIAQDLGVETSRIKADIVRMKREVQRAESDIRHTDSLIREEEALATKNQQRWQADRERREKENQVMSSRLQEIRAKITVEHGRLQSSRNGSDELRAKDKALLHQLAGVADSLRRRIESSLPWDLEARSERILALKRDLEAGSTTPDEAWSRLSAILKDEIKNGDEVILLNRPLTRQNGEVINAQLLKLGNQALIYMDEDGKKFGMLEKTVSKEKSAFVWREDLSTEERNTIKKALAVKAGREPPQLIPLGITLAPGAQ